MTSDLVQRLRKFKIATDPAFPIHPAICDEAANESERTRHIIESAWNLFEKAQGSLGYPDASSLKQQDDVAEAFREWRCDDVGHELGPDQCGRLEHDVCWRCNRLASVLGYRRGERKSDGTWEYVPIEAGVLPLLTTANTDTSNTDIQYDDGM